MLTGIGDIASTSFITLYCHALETLSDNPLLSDPKSVEIMTELNKTLSRSENTLDKTLCRGHPRQEARCPYCDPCAKKYDEYARDLLEEIPGRGHCQYRLRAGLPGS